MTQRSDAVSPEIPRRGNRQFLTLGVAVVIVGVLLAILGSGWEWSVGLSLLALAVPPLLMGLGLPGPATIERWFGDEHAVS